MQRHLNIMRTHNKVKLNLIRSRKQQRKSFKQFFLHTEIKIGEKSHRINVEVIKESRKKDKGILFHSLTYHLMKICINNCYFENVNESMEK